MTETILLKHPLLGSIVGRRKGQVAQFLGIKYGSLKHRFATSEVAIPGNSDPFTTATNYGPPVVSPPESCDMEMSFIQQSLEKPTIPPMSDLEGLNLNITLPLVDGQLPSLHTNRGLPVLVYVHGGGFFFGSNSYPHYDQARIAEQGMRDGCPFIAMNINYRLGAPGFLTSREIRNAGCPTNNGLRDQQTAFRWVKKYISGFGGDPDAITAIGQSAGAASLTYHLHSPEPFFNRCVLLAGTSLMMRPVDADTAESVYEVVLKALGLDQLAPQDRFDALLKTDFTEFVQKLGPIPALCPVVDHDLIPGVPSFDRIANDGDLPLPGRKWCQSLMSVDCECDGSIFALVNLNPRERGIRKAFQDSIRSSLGENRSKALIDFYKITDGTPDSTALRLITDFISDVMFFAPSIAFANAWDMSFVGHFNEGNPWEGLYQDRANHMLDIAYLWQNFNDKFTLQQEAVSTTFARDVVAFTASLDRLPPFKSERKVTVYGPSRAGITSDVKDVDDEATGRKYKKFFKMADEVGGLDAVLDAAGTFLMG
ncbi:uncharacterized protein A1O5_10624 [Cladophialophora psammophila CBS 110553]|uniref:Carboxylesterase type B domain-containing protein n=1 Tax=Cladophialophora psammophila CBS 110553 TaxID=1182543 RepID=W9WEC8_9EURO|nr:uncharacterized protein A1O5_10624 [Cladophialophora psammophila CBS 110553]EXJ66472.1 hypothetical protein A1O5_10624 [Cladophialophora psammophila CBS 110553]